MNNYCIYIHTNLKNGKVYIGKAINPKTRWGHDGNGYKNCPRFWSAIQHYGWDNFSHEIIKENLSKEQADEEERFFIQYYNATDSTKGYNLTQGGTGGNTHYNWTEGQKQEYQIKCQKENDRRIKETDWLQKLSKAQTERWKKEKLEGIKRNHPKGKDNPMAKPVKCVETQQIFPSCADAAEWLGYPRNKSSYISRVANGNRKTCKGYRWEFINE